MEEIMRIESVFGKFHVVVAMTVMAVAVGCGGGNASGDVDVLSDTPAADSVVLTDAGPDVAGDVAISRDDQTIDADDIVIPDDSAAGAESNDVDDSCGTCTGGKICVQGECRCPQSQHDCAGTCTTFGTNDNCSGCGDVCNADQICQDGQCETIVQQECVTTIACVTDGDCGSGYRCNQALVPPTCQRLYCGGFGTGCTEYFFCRSGLCVDGVCIGDCSGLECGPDPVYGESCGTCQPGAVCESNHCVCDPQDHLECVENDSTWIDSCGDVGELNEDCLLACLDGECVDCDAVGMENCSGTCTPLGTDSNCSDCGDVCPTGGSCESGTCECPENQVDCSGTCTLLGTADNCSTCGHQCTGGKVCVEGSCECPVGKVDCSGTCKSLGTILNCSGCGDVCTGGKECIDSQCQCPVNQVICYGICTILGTDDNCSECGDECAENETCDNGICESVSQVLIPGGSFWMGCNSAVDTQCYSDEKPYHEVTLSGYYIDRTEVTVGSYAECVTAGTCTSPSTYSSYCNWGVSGKTDHPVNCVTWYQAVDYCEWRGGRLCTEAEWEKAARGTDGRKYPWGNETATCDYAVMDDGGDGCGTDSTWEVCGKSPAGDSPYGLCDMSGNVWEWVSDWYGSGYYADSSSVNPTGPVSGPYRVRRGGSFVSDAGYLRASYRDYVDPSYAYYVLGVRCCRPQ